MLLTHMGLAKLPKNFKKLLSNSSFTILEN